MKMRSLYQTDIEKIMYETLLSLNLHFSFQHSIRTKYGYIVDFYLPASSIVIECDGERWHQDKKRENRRDAVLKKFNLKVLHFSGAQIKKDIEQCKQKILEEIERRKK